MATNHVLTCPNCFAQLLLEHSDSVGGVVQPNVRLLDFAKETPVSAKARAAMEAAQATLDEANAALDKAQQALDAEAAKIPTDAEKVRAESDKVEAARADRDKAQAALDVAAADYERAKSLPPPPAVGALSPDGRWKWDGSKWVEVAATPPPMPASLVVEEAVEETPAAEAVEA